MEKDISSLRSDYTGAALDEKRVSLDPFQQFEIWFREALQKKVMEPNAMALASVDVNGAPQIRMVLLKDYSSNGFTFFTNYTSKKGKDFENNPQASILFFWPELARQIRINGVVSKVDPNISESYFKERPRESQISAWISQQSSELDSKDDLIRKYSDFNHHHKGADIGYPAFWGGYILKPSVIEFWQGQQNRLHDRVQYTYLVENERWKITRLAP